MAVRCLVVRQQRHAVRVEDRHAVDPEAHAEHRALLAEPDPVARGGALEVELHRGQHLAPADHQPAVPVPAPTPHPRAARPQLRLDLVRRRHVLRLRHVRHARLLLHVVHLRAVLVAPRHERVSEGDRRNRALVLVDHHVLIGEPALLIQDHLALQPAAHEHLVLRRRVQTERLRRHATMEAKRE